jgi:hypothetical protein
MAAGEDQPQAVVSDQWRVLWQGILLGGRWLERLELLLLLGAAALAPEPVDCLVARGGRDPGARVVRDAALGPDLQGDDEGLLDRVLGEVEVAENADQRGDRPSRLVAEQAIDQLRR